MKNYLKLNIFISYNCFPFKKIKFIAVFFKHKMNYKRISGTHENDLILNIALLLISFIKLKN